MGFHDSLELVHVLLFVHLSLFNFFGLCVFLFANYVGFSLVQAAIKELLPAALEDPHGKIRTAVGMAIASIANWDWPEEWPGLMGYLLSLINDRTDVNKGSDHIFKLEASSS